MFTKGIKIMHYLHYKLYQLSNRPEPYLGDGVRVSPDQPDVGPRLGDVRVWLERAALHGAPVVALQHDVEDVLGAVGVSQLLRNKCILY